MLTSFISFDVVDNQIDTKSFFTFASSYRTNSPASGYMNTFSHRAIVYKKIKAEIL